MYGRQAPSVGGPRLQEHAGRREVITLIRFLAARVPSSNRETLPQRSLLPWGRSHLAGGGGPGALFGAAKHSPGALLGAGSLSQGPQPCAPRETCHPGHWRSTICHTCCVTASYGPPALKPSRQAGSSQVCQQGGGSAGFLRATQVKHQLGAGWYNLKAKRPSLYFKGVFYQSQDLGQGEVSVEPEPRRGLCKADVTWSDTGAACKAREHSRSSHNSGLLFCHISPYPHFFFSY